MPSMENLQEKYHFQFFVLKDLRLTMVKGKPTIRRHNNEFQCLL